MKAKAPAKSLRIKSVKTRTALKARAVPSPKLSRAPKLPGAAKLPKESETPKIIGSQKLSVIDKGDGARRIEGLRKVELTRKVELVKMPKPFDAPKLVVKPIVKEEPSVVPTPVVRPVLAPINFKSGDKVVYPGHGPGEIDSVRLTSIGGQECQFYSITILETGMKVMVAVTQAGQVGLRKVVNRSEVDKVYEILRDRNFKIDTQTWNRRFRKYSEKIKTGSVYEIATVLRDLLVLRADKELSFSEKKIFDMAQHLLVSEIAIAKARPQEKVMTELAEFFG